MNVPIPEVRVGEVIEYGGLGVFPLFAASTSRLDYLLSEEAMAAGKVVVREVSEAGSVGELLVDNGGDQHVLFLEGEELRGAKQNRTIRSSVLVAGRSQTKIPVTCVERGRWRYDSPGFSAGSCCPPTLRHLLKQGSVGGGGTILVRPFAQTAVWREIRRRHRATGVSSGTENLTDALDKHRGLVENLRGRLPCPEGASGVAVAIGGRLVSIDLLDKPATLGKLWDRFMQGLALDALEAGDNECRATGIGISVRLYKTMEATWRQVGSVGLGQCHRAQDGDMLATALVVDNSLVHLSMSMPTKTRCEREKP